MNYRNTQNKNNLNGDIHNARGYAKHIILNLILIEEH
jgi:hypothetical protein